MRDWQRLVSNTAHAVDAIVSFLEHGEAVCLLVTAIDARMEKLARFVFEHPHILLLGDDSKKHASVLHCAAAHGQIAVVQWVLRHRSMWLTRKCSGGGGGDDGSLAASSTNSVRPFIVSVADSDSDSDPEATAANILPRLKAMAWVNRNVPYVFPPEVMYEAARQGDRHVVEWLHTTSQYEPYKAMEFAASRGHLEIVQWLYDNEKSALQPSKNGVDAAQIYMLVPLYTPAEDDHNSADVMNWIAVFVKRKYFREAFAMRKGLFGSYDQRDDSIDWDQESARDFKFSQKRYKAIDFAASAGNLELIKKLHADKQWPCTSQAMDGAARLGHLDVVQWLHKNRTEGCTSNAIAAAAGNGHFKLAQWLHEHRFEGCRSYAMDLTASHGHLQILQWLYQEYPRFSCTQPFLPCVAANNHQHVLRWLHEEKGFAYDLRTVEAAIANGHFALTQWLLKQEPDLKTQLTPPVVAKAAKSGNAAMTQWLIEDLGLWSPKALAGAAIAGNLELVKWLHNLGRPNDLVSSIELFDLAQKCDFELLEWLLKRKLGQPKFVSPSREFGALFANMKEAAGEKTINQPAAKRMFAWDLHTKECPSWLSKYARLALKYCPEFLLDVDSSPILSAQRGELHVLRSLALAGHPEVYTKQTFHALLTFTKAGGMVQWFFETSSTEYLDASVVEWAAKFQLVGLLEYCFAKMEGVNARYRVHACETVMRTACLHGHLELLRWGVTKLESLSSSPPSAVNPAAYTKAIRTTAKDIKDKLSTPLWAALSTDAAANGHTQILKWIISKRWPRTLLNNNTPQAHLQKLVDAAAENGHVHVLKWIDSALKDASVLISKSGREAAIANKHFNVIQWLVDHHQELVSHLDQASQDEIAICLDEGMDGFVPAGISYFLHSSNSQNLTRWRLLHPTLQ